MPTIYRYKGFRFHFYSDEGLEPPQVHIRRAEDTCKFWLDSVSLAFNDGMRTSELKELEGIARTAGWNRLRRRASRGIPGEVA